MGLSKAYWITGTCVVAGLLAQNTRAEPLPATWEGAWSGNCRSSRQTPGMPSAYAMALSISPIRSDGARDFKITYDHGSTRETRQYLLVPVDVQAGHYVVDERNSILLDSYFSGESLTSLFSLNDRVFLIQYTMTSSGRIVVNMPRWGARPTRVSGGQGQIPRVTAFQMDDLDHCALEKVEP